MEKKLSPSAVGDRKRKRKEKNKKLFPSADGDVGDGLLIMSY
jgi:hypothetical protein